MPTGNEDDIVQFAEITAIGGQHDTRMPNSEFHVPGVGNTRPLHVGGSDNGVAGTAEHSCQAGLRQIVIDIQVHDDPFILAVGAWGESCRIPPTRRFLLRVPPKPGPCSACSNR